MRIFLLLLTVLFYSVDQIGGVPIPIPPAASQCPQQTDAFKHDDAYYQFFDCPTTWEKAESICSSRMVIDEKTVSGGHLVSVLDDEEKAWLKFQLDMRYGAKIGVWIGLKRNDRGSSRSRCPDSYSWTDGSAYSFKSWEDAEPNCHWPGEECVHIRTDNEKWNDAECQLQFRFVCKWTERREGGAQPPPEDGQGFGTHLKPVDPPGGGQDPDPRPKPPKPPGPPKP